MSQQEVTRQGVVQRVQSKQLTQVQGAVQLGLSVRQVKRLVKAYAAHGAKGLVSKHRGHPSNHQLPVAVKAEALQWIQRRYPDFGPTLAHEKLREVHGLDLSVETVRQLMIAHALWTPKHPKRPVVHQLRERRPCLGELVQIDGSPHDWFEGRGPRCTLLVYIDDATGRFQYLQFVPAETTWAYFAATQAYLLLHGQPRAFYSDKYSVFRINASTAVGGSGLTQFGRALQELDIQLICAHTPQAKGRVERANQTLQDRLVKELRLRGCSDMASANEYLPEFRAQLNDRFGVAPRNPLDAHRPLTRELDLARILTLQEPRVLSKNLTLQYDKVLYQIETNRPSYALRQAQVLVCEAADGTIRIEYKGKPLKYTIAAQQGRQAKVVTDKDLDQALTHAPKAQRRSPALAPDHPWKQPFLKRPEQPLPLALR
jgi:hypothetical protein